MLGEEGNDVLLLQKLRDDVDKNPGSYFQELRNFYERGGLDGIF